jgi:hypothetical protein
MAGLLLSPVWITSTISLRQLPVEEWTRLSEAGGPLSGHQLPAAPDHAVVIVAEIDGDTIIAYWVAAAMVHLDPLYIDPAYRHHPKLALGLLGLLTHLLQQAGVTYAQACVAPEDQPGNGVLLEKLGFSALPGTLYRGAIPPAEG